MQRFEKRGLQLWLRSTVGMVQQFPTRDRNTTFCHLVGKECPIAFMLVPQILQALNLFYIEST